MMGLPNIALLFILLGACSSSSEQPRDMRSAASAASSTNAVPVVSASTQPSAAAAASPLPPAAAPAPAPGEATVVTTAPLPAPGPAATPPVVVPSCQAAGAVASMVDDSGVKVVAFPAERAVIQRAADNTGTVLVSVQATINTTCLEVSTVLSPDAGSSGSGVTWQKLAGQQITANADGVTRTITGSFKQATGGWYTLSFRPWTSGSTYGSPTSALTTHVDHVGVGEVFLVAGQSNSSNYGNAAMNAFVPDNRVSAAYSMAGSAATPAAWATAKTPIPGPFDGGGGGGPWGWAGTLLQHDLKMPIGFALVGWGGTSSAQWLPAGAGQPGGQSPGFLFQRLVSTAQNLQTYTGGFRAVLWHQGESDAQALVPSATYEQNMRAMVAAFRTQTTTRVPWLIARASWLLNYSPTQVTAMQGIEAAQDRLRADTAAGFLPGSVTDDLITCNSVVGDGGYRDCINNNSAHLSYIGLTVHGQRWHDVLMTPGLIPVP